MKIYLQYIAKNSICFQTTHLLTALIRYTCGVSSLVNLIDSMFLYRIKGNTLLHSPDINVYNLIICMKCNSIEAT